MRNEQQAQVLRRSEEQVELDLVVVPGSGVCCQRDATLDAGIVDQSSQIRCRVDDLRCQLLSLLQVAQICDEHF